jgi:hypothetical protein
MTVGRVAYKDLDGQLSRISQIGRGEPSASSDAAVPSTAWEEPPEQTRLPIAVPVDLIRAVWWALPGPATVDQPRQAKQKHREAGDQRNEEEVRVAEIYRSTSWRRSWRPSRMAVDGSMPPSWH